MYSLGAAIVVALVIACVAWFKGRTAWHWFALALGAFVGVVVLSVGSLYIANVQLSLQTADKLLAGGAGALTGAVMLILVLCVPARPKRHSQGLGTARRDSQP